MTMLSPFPTPTALVGAALMATHTLAAAQATPSALAECAAISSDSDRLACYDRLSGRAGRPSSATKTDAAAVPPAPAAAGSATAAAASAAPCGPRLR